MTLNLIIIYIKLQYFETKIGIVLLGIKIQTVSFSLLVFINLFISQKFKTTLLQIIYTDLEIYQNFKKLGQMSIGFTFLINFLLVLIVYPIITGFINFYESNFNFTTLNVLNFLFYTVPVILNNSMNHTFIVNLIVIKKGFVLLKQHLEKFIHDDIFQSRIMKCI